MASDKSYLDYILEGLSELEEITYRKMMGEYIIYYKGRIISYIADNRMLIKPCRSALALLKDARMERPYAGAKEMILIEDTDNRDLLKKLFEASYEELYAEKD